MNEAVLINPFKTMTDLASIPSVERILQQEATLDLISNYGRSLVIHEIRVELEVIRQRISGGVSVPEIPEILRKIRSNLESLENSSIQPVINATGVILHTNLGRAPLSQSAGKAILDTISSYSNVEVEIKSGNRNHRTDQIEKLLQKYLGVESALVVNNNAAAVFLVLRALASKRRVIISRNQMIEIGGGFRIPEILKQSGAHLLEIGTTNQIRMDDYRTAIQEGGALILHVHPANFKITGYTNEPSLCDLVKLAHEHNLPVVDDIGSGALLDTSRFGLSHEPMVQESLAAGADVVCFSGDKLVGGPQAGFIVGKSKFLSMIKKHPLARVLRADKSLIAGIEATLLSYLRDRAENDIPIWQMIRTNPESLLARVEYWLTSIGEGQVTEGLSTVGGGSLPEEVLPTWLFTLVLRKPDIFAGLCRKSKPAIFARVQDGKVYFDPRTVLPEQDDKLVEIIRSNLIFYREKYEN